MKQIYPDANIWNALCKQSVDPNAFVTALGKRGATLVLSLHAIYELARTFASTKPTSRAQGIALFRCVEKFIKAGILCSKQLMEFVGDEAVAYLQQQSAIDPLLDAAGRAFTLDEVTKLAAGTVEPRVNQFVADRTAFAADSRTDQKDHFVGKPIAKNRLTMISEAALPTWLAAETMSPNGLVIISAHLSKMMGTVPPAAFVRAFLNSTVGGASRAVVRAALYSNWRSANRGSTPKDLLDDMLHVLQAVYCDIYVTEESGQSDYAALLLPATTKVAIYDKTQPIDQWLIGLF